MDYFSCIQYVIYYSVCMYRRTKETVYVSLPISKFICSVCFIQKHVFCYDIPVLIFDLLETLQHKASNVFFLISKTEFNQNLILFKLRLKRRCMYERSFCFLNKLLSISLCLMWKKCKNFNRLESYVCTLYECALWNSTENWIMYRISRQNTTKARRYVTLMIYQT